MEQDQAVAGRGRRVLLWLGSGLRSDTHACRLFFQGIFKHYNADQSGSINSYEMRNAVNDAGDEKDVVGRPLVEPDGASLVALRDFKNLFSQSNMC